jgi:hypothetical protein
VTIEQAIRHGNASAGKWSTITKNGVTTLYHYSTAMLVWNTDEPHDSSVLGWDFGWGSVSDQGGMNRAFEELGLPYYYSRKGGASIISLNSAEECKNLPYYKRRINA